MLTPDEMIQSILARRDDADGVRTIDLLDFLFRGYPFDRILPLLRSDNDDVAATGIWLVEELGLRARPHLALIAEFLGHRYWKVRYSAIDSILSCGTPADWLVDLRAAELSTDEHPSVRWKAMNFLARLSQARVDACNTHSIEAGVAPAYAAGFALLCDVTERGRAHARQLLTSGDQIQRTFAAAFAARVKAIDPSLVELASKSQFEEVRRFGNDWLTSGE